MCFITTTTLSSEIASCRKLHTVEEEDNLDLSRKKRRGNEGT